MRKFGFTMGLLLGIASFSLYTVIAAWLGGPLPMLEGVIGDMLPLYAQSPSSFNPTRQIAVITTAYGTALVDVVDNVNRGIRYRWRYTSHLFGRETSGEGQAFEPSNGWATLKAGPVHLNWSSGFYLYPAPNQRLETLPKHAFGSFDFEPQSGKMRQATDRSSAIRLTKTNMRAIGTALGSYYVDHETFPAAPTLVEFSTEILDQRLISKNLLKDGWGKTFLYVSDGTSYSLICYGKDEDFVYANGKFVSPAE